MKLRFKTLANNMQQNTNNRKSKFYFLNQPQWRPRTIDIPKATATIKIIKLPLH